MPAVSGKPKAGKGKTTIQTLIFPKSSFTKAQAKKWAKDHGHKVSLEETGSSYRARQFNPNTFQSGSLRTIDLGSGVKAVIGKPKVNKEQVYKELVIAINNISNSLSSQLRQHLKD